MNELIFFFHISAILFSVYIFSRFGKVGLTAIFVLQLIFANLFILKQAVLFGLTVTTTDCYTIGSFITLNLLRERFGKEAANKSILIGLFSILFLPLMSFFLLAYTPAIEGASMSNLYTNLLAPSSRIFFVSVLCMTAFQKLDTLIFAKLRKKVGFQSSMLIALLITQFLDTLCFTYGALAGVLQNLPSIVIFSYLIKVITIVIMTPATKLLTRKIA
ncbi:MAG: queuosine precursor transporter [Chlamydiia bacterium]|nr:queuosine precursor transporter [Chlamydiia bacterium]MCH9617916.1 queuosine precursor transporter [Chlamydiia bacterium]MCH9624132.1 queuosine precursor transporter [Chlamydiia bacterium]